MADINLIPSEEKAHEGAERTDKKLQFVSIGVLVISAVVTLFTLIMYTKSVSEKNALILQVEENSAKINQYKPQEELLVVSKDKAGAADKVLSGRTDYAMFFTKLASIIPQGVYFTDIRISDSKITAPGRAKSSADVAGLVSALTTGSGPDIINSVSIDSLSSDEFGVYGFVISGKLAGAKK